MEPELKLGVLPKWLVRFSRIRIAEPNRPMVLLLWLNSSTKAVRRGNEKQMTESQFPSRNFTRGFTVLYEEWRTALAASFDELTMLCECCLKHSTQPPVSNPPQNMNRQQYAYFTINTAGLVRNPPVAVEQVSYVSFLCYDLS